MNNSCFFAIQCHDPVVNGFIEDKIVEYANRYSLSSQIIRLPTQEALLAAPRSDVICITGSELMAPLERGNQGISPEVKTILGSLGRSIFDLFILVENRNGEVGQLSSSACNPALAHMPLPLWADEDPEEMTRRIGRYADIILNEIKKTSDRTGQNQSHLKVNAVPNMA